VRISADTCAAMGRRRTATSAFEILLRVNLRTRPPAARDIQAAFRKDFGRHAAARAGTKSRKHHKFSANA